MKSQLLLVSFLVLAIFSLPHHVLALERWGNIANSNYQNKKIASTLFFAGPPNPNALPNYTKHPLEGANSQWTDQSIQFSLNQMKLIGINTIKVSYWGHDGETDNWATSLLFSNRDWTNQNIILSESETINRAKHFFQLVDENQLMFSPLIEVSPANPFYEQFPNDTSNMVNRIVWLVNNFGNEPGWLKVYDKNGIPRLAVWLIETIHLDSIDPNVFAIGLDTISARVEQATGKKIGLIIDPTPLPPYGSEAGPDPNSLAQTQSVLAVNPFNITSQGLSGQSETTVTEDDRLAYAESVVKKWSSTPIPFITPFLPGYDAHIVFPTLGKYGFNNSWLNKQKDKLLPYPNKGVSFDVWNGYTEGYTIVPTVEDGDSIYEWARNIIALENIQRPVGNLNSDDKVDIFDYNILLQNFGNTTCDNVADIDGNCKVDIFDYNILVGNFGKTP